MTTGAKDNSSEASGTATEMVTVWDLPVRLFHWSLVILFAMAWISAEEWDKLHEWVGYIIGGLVAFRIVWGLMGSQHARFTDFLYRPSIVVGYIKDSISLRAKRYIGHNPAGGAMVIALLLSIIVVTVSGIAMTDVLPISGEWIEEIHEAAANFTLLLVAFHIAGVIFASFEHGENLIRSMFTGNKRKNPA